MHFIIGKLFRTPQGKNDLFELKNSSNDAWRALRIPMSDHGTISTDYIL